MWEYNYLAHYGIIGQKWGVRRFQNEDGSLTDEGKARYSNAFDAVDSNTMKAEREFGKAKSLVLNDQNVLRNWDSAYNSYKSKEPDLLKKYNNKYLNSSRVNDIEKQKDLLVKDFYKANEMTKLTIFDVFSGSKEASIKRDAVLNKLKETYKELNKKLDSESRRIAYEVFQELPKYERIIAMGMFSPNEGEWKKIRKANKL